MPHVRTRLRAATAAPRHSMDTHTVGLHRFIALQDVDIEMGPTIYLLGRRPSRRSRPSLAATWARRQRRMRRATTADPREFLLAGGEAGAAQGGRPGALPCRRFTVARQTRAQTASAGSFTSRSRTRRSVQATGEHTAGLPQQATLAAMRDELAALKADDGESGVFAKLDAIDALEVRDTDGPVRLGFAGEPAAPAIGAIM